MKNRQTYKILTYVGLVVPFGINRMYLGLPWVARALTMNYFLMGSIGDLFYMDKTFDEAMTRRGYVNTTMRG